MTSLSELREVERYTATVRQKVLAKAGMDRIANA